MTYINPLATSLLSSAQVQNQQGADKARQVRRAQVVARNVAARADRFEHEVENAEAITPTGDGQGNRQEAERRPPRRKPQENAGGEEAHLDVKA